MHKEFAMTETNSLEILRQSLEKILPEKDGREKISSLEFIINLIFCYFGDSKTFSLESIRKLMKKNLEIDIKRSGFWERLAGNRLKKHLKRLVSDLMAKFRAG